MRQQYLLEWFDTLISITLNPGLTDIRHIGHQEEERLIQAIRKEATTVKTKLKYRVFSLTREKHIRLFLQNHYNSILILHAQVLDRKKVPLFQSTGLKQVLNALEDSLQELLSFLDTWFARYLNPGSFSKRRTRKTIQPIKEQEKVLCDLSTDQVALVLRAADELRILKARSLRSVFKTIVPHLSTPNKEHISPDAMRVNAYKAEDRDKQVTIEQLKQIIKKIKDY